MRLTRFLAVILFAFAANAASPVVRFNHFTTNAVTVPIGVSIGGTGGTNAAQARSAIGLDVGSPGALGTNMLASSSAAVARSLIGLSAGSPGSIPTNFLTASDEYSVWDALKQSQTRLLSVPGVPQSAIPQDCIVYNAPVDVPASFTGGAGATLSQGIETNGSSKISMMYTAGGTWANLKVVGDGVQATPTVTHYPATTQDWSGCHFIVKAYVEGSTNGWSDAYSSLTVTLYDDAGYYCTGTMNAFTPETATTTNGFFYTGSIQIPSPGDYLSANWSFQSTTAFNPARIKRFVLNIGMSDAAKVVPIHIGAITVAKSPNKKGIVCIIFDQTKEYGLPYAAALKNFGFTATWAFNTNSSYQYWSDWELIRNYDQGHGYNLYGNDTVTTTNHWEIITRNSGGPRYLSALGIDPASVASMVVFGGTGSPAYNVKQDEVGRLLLRKYGMQFYNSASATKVIYPADLPSTIVRLQSLTKSNYAPTATGTNSIANGTVYYVFSGPTNGTTAVTYNGTNYQLGQSFIGASGVNNYIVTGTGAVCTRTGWQAAYEAAVKSGGMVAALIHAHTDYAELPYLISLMGGLWARDAMLGRLEVIPISKVFERQRQGWPRRPVNAVAKTGGTNSYEVAIDAIITELQRGGLMRE